MASLAGAFGVLALILACVGIYGIVAYGVARRTGEIGIRMALGAVPNQVTWMVLKETLLLVGVGIVIGVPSVLGLSPLLDHSLAAPYTKNFLYELKPGDPPTIITAILVLAA